MILSMVTLAHTLNLNEFELHARVVLGLPIAGIHLESAGAIAVILAKNADTLELKRKGKVSCCHRY